MKGFIFLGLLTSSCFYAQTSTQDSLKTHDIESINFLKRLPVTKEIINVEKDLGTKNLGQDFLVVRVIFVIVPIVIE